MPKELKEIKEQTKEVVKFDVETAVIVALDTKYKDVRITDNKSKAIIMEGLGEYRELRLEVVAGHKEAKDKINRDGRWLDSERRRILARLAPGEDRLKAIRQAYEDEIDRIEAEKVRLEKERKENIRAKIFKIQESAMPTVLGVMILEHLRELSISFEDMEITVEKYQEFTDEATKVIEDSYNAVQEAITARIKLDKEEEGRKAEAERLAKVQLKQEVDQAVIDKANKTIKAAQKKIADEKAQLDDRRWRSRLDKLATVIWNGQEAIDPQTDKVIISYENLIDFSDTKFAEIAAGWNHIVEERQKAKAEDERKEKEAFEKEATEKAEATARTKVADAANKKEEKKKADEAEKARLEALKPDKEKLISLAEIVFTLSMPQVNSYEAGKIITWAIGVLNELAEQIKKKAQEL